MPTIDYKKILLPDRFDSETTNSNLLLAYSSDKSRVIFSAPFRRLQQKAQVFGLETNAAVRSRLTHTLEVANTGSLLAKRISDLLVKASLLKPEMKLPFIDLTETCCLLHDIGNPPFGHFGEAAIQEWFKNYWKAIYRKVSGKPDFETPFTMSYMNDFFYFDGNPQGIRIILKLQNLPGDYTNNGFNLTFSQILSCVKYMFDPDDAKAGTTKKAGYFHSEKGKIMHIQSKLSWRTRFPITYIMEAADDISYCLSDIEDGIEKKIITSEFFFKKLFLEWKNPDLAQFKIKEKPKDLSTDYDFFFFKVRLTRNLIRMASEIFLKSQKKISEGKMGDLLDSNTEAKRALSALKNFSRKYLFRSPEAERIELAGYKVIFGLLEAFRPLMKLKRAEFDLLVNSRENMRSVSESKLDIQLRLFNKLPEKHVQAYKKAVADIEQNNQEIVFLEWYYRAHLITDYISGMTDTFALETYRLLNGIHI